MWKRRLRVCQVWWGRDARVPGGHHPMAGFPHSSSLVTSASAPHRISLRHSAWLLRLPLKGGVIFWDKPHSSFTHAARDGRVPGWLTTEGLAKPCQLWCGRDARAPGWGSAQIENGGMGDAAVSCFPGSGAVSYRSKRSRVITLVQAAMKSWTKSFLASPAA